MGELEYLKEHFKSTLIHFTDDTFTLNKDRAKEICQQIINRLPNIEWVCDTRADCLDRELIILMKKAGCVRIKIGVESGSDRILKLIQKGETTEQIRQTVKWIKEESLPFTLYFMAGFPQETNEDLYVKDGRLDIIELEKVRRLIAESFMSMLIKMEKYLI